MLKVRKSLKVRIIEAASANDQVYRHFKMPRGIGLLLTILRDLGYEAKGYCEDLAPVDWQDVMDADVIGISSVTPTANRGYALIKEIRSRQKALPDNRHIPIIMGGVHATFMDEEALLKGADFVVRREGDKTLPELLEAIAGKRRPEGVLGISFFYFERLVRTRDRPFLTSEELDDLPFPDETLIVGHKKIRLPMVITRRGCPFNCTFCSVIQMFGRKPRARSVENVLDELEWRARREKGKKLKLLVGDDNFPADEERAIAISRGIIERQLDISWTTQGRTNTSLRALKEMRAAGMGYMYVGVESISPAALKKANKHQTVEDIRASFERCREAGVKMHVMIVFGFPSDTSKTVRATLEFIEEYKDVARTAQFLALTPFPGTPLHEELEAAGRICDRNYDHYNAHTVVIIPEGMKPAELQEEVCWATRRFYSKRRVLSELLAGDRVLFAISLLGYYEARRWSRGDSLKSYLQKLRGLDLSSKEALPDTTA